MVKWCLIIEVVRWCPILEVGGQVVSIKKVSGKAVSNLKGKCQLMSNIGERWSDGV